MYDSISWWVCDFPKNLTLHESIKPQEMIKTTMRGKGKKKYIYIYNMVKQKFRWIKEFLWVAGIKNIKKEKKWQRWWCFELVITARCCVYLTFSSPSLPAFGIYMFNWEVCCRFLLPICRVPSSYQTHSSNWQLSLSAYLSFTPVPLHC